MNIQKKIDATIKKTGVFPRYHCDNLLSCSAALQPNFLVWVWSLTRPGALSDETRAICLENAIAETLGSKGEGNHYRLSRNFFRQLGKLNSGHRDRVEREVDDIYDNIHRPKVVLTVVTCIEIALSQVVLAKIRLAMEGYRKSYNITDFRYLDVHEEVDTDHGAKFLKALIAERPNEKEVDDGTELCVNLFRAIFG